MDTRRDNFEELLNRPTSINHTSQWQQKSYKSTVQVQTEERSERKLVFRRQVQLPVHTKFRRKQSRQNKKKKKKKKKRKKKKKNVYLAK